MNKWLQMIALAGLVVLLVGCGTVDTETVQTEQVVQVSPTFTAPPPTVAPSATPLVVRSAADVQRITPAEAKTLLDEGQAVLYDARSAGSYHTQHAAGAVSFPEADVSARFSELPTDQELIFY
jgi:hypothetical protein